MLISSANASAPSPTSTSTGTVTTSGAGVVEPSPFSSIIPLVLIFVVFYFLLIRPQQKKLKEHEALVSGIKRGDKVVTGGGILGQVTKVEADSQYIMVEIAQGVNVRVIRSTVISLIDKSPSTDEEGKDKKDKKADKSDTKPTANDNAEGLK
jgi:preprotein translocase subunit YajC